MNFCKLHSNYSVHAYYMFLRPPHQPESYGLKLEVVLKCRNIYIENIRMVSLIAGLKMGRQGSKLTLSLYHGDCRNVPWQDKKPLLSQNDNIARKVVSWWPSADPDYQWQ